MMACLHIHTHPKIPVPEKLFQVFPYNFCPFQLKYPVLYDNLESAPCQLFQVFCYNQSVSVQVLHLALHHKFLFFSIQEHCELFHMSTFLISSISLFSVDISSQVTTTYVLIRRLTLTPFISTDTHLAFQFLLYSCFLQCFKTNNSLHSSCVFWVLIMHIPMKETKFQILATILFSSNVFRLAMHIQQLKDQVPKDERSDHLSFEI